MALYNMNIGRIVFDDVANTMTLYLSAQEPPAPLPDDIAKMVGAGKATWYSQVFTITLPAQRRLVNTASYVDYFDASGTKMRISWDGKAWSSAAPAVAPAPAKATSTRKKKNATIKEKE